MQAAKKFKSDDPPKYPAGIISLQVLGTGATGSPSSLYVFADQTRYIFNCGEGTQRLGQEHKMKLSRLENIFITSKQWDKLGGLPGMSLTLQEMGCTALTLHGPPGLDQIFTSTCRFIIMKNLVVKATDCVAATHFEDHIMRVEYLPIFPSEPAKSEQANSSPERADDIHLDPSENNIDYYSYKVGMKRCLTEPCEAKRRKQFDSLIPEERESVENTLESPVKCAMSYVCRPKPKEGRLLINKCVEMGVPSGPLLGVLKAGKNVTLPNGEVVLAADVRSPDICSAPFIVVDCPNDDYIENFIAHSEWAKYQPTSAASSVEAPSVIVHFTPKSVVLHDKYREWMRSFGSSVPHLFLNSFAESTGCEALHSLQYKLNLFDEKIFPVIKSRDRLRLSSFTFDEVTGWKKNPRDIVKHVTEPELPSCLNNFGVPIVLGESLLKFTIRPASGFEKYYRSMIVGLCKDDYIKEAEAMEGFTEELAKYKEKVGQLDSCSREYPEILFLGTGSAIPNKARNVSGIMLNISHDVRMILDCGEGTFGQLFRFYGEENISEILTEIKCIYISHLHADHHLGLIQILQERAKAFNSLNRSFEPVTLFAPHQILFWLRTYHYNFEPIRDLYTIVANISLTKDYDGSFVPHNLPTIIEKLGLCSIETCRVKHCVNSFGVAVVHVSGWKICYSGDTQPCDDFIELGANSDVCIHEATMEDELADEAKAKMHSTVSQALEVGRKMKAKYIILTHFSQRYAKVPKFDVELDSNVAFAFDNMLVKLSDLPKIPAMYPALKCMFQDYIEDLEIKVMKKKAQRDQEQVAIKLQKIECEN